MGCMSLSQQHPILPGALVTPPKDLECLVKSRKDNGVLCIHKSKQKNQTADFLSGPVMKNPPCNAGDAGSIPSRGTKSPHASKQLSPSALSLHATTRGSWGAMNDPALRNEDPLCHN